MENPKGHLQTHSTYVTINYYTEGAKKKPTVPEFSIKHILSLPIVYFLADCVYLHRILV